MTQSYATNSPEACNYVASDSYSNIIVLENQKQLNKILHILLFKYIQDFIQIQNNM